MDYCIRKLNSKLAERLVNSWGVFHGNNLITHYWKYADARAYVKNHNNPMPPYVHCTINDPIWTRGEFSFGWK